MTDHLIGIQARYMLTFNAGNASRESASAGLARISYLLLLALRETSPIWEFDSVTVGYEVETSTSSFKPMRAGAVLSVRIISS